MAMSPMSEMVSSDVSVAFDMIEKKAELVDCTSFHRLNCDVTAEDDALSHALPWKLKNGESMRVEVVLAKVDEVTVRSSTSRLPFESVMKRSPANHMGRTKTLMVPVPEARFSSAVPTIIPGPLALTA